MADQNGYIPIDEHYADDDGTDIDDDSTELGALLLQSQNFDTKMDGDIMHTGHYWGPNDEESIKHQNIANHLFLLTLKDKLFLAPLHDPRKVLDVGTGAGMWAMYVHSRSSVTISHKPPQLTNASTPSSDFADQFPRAAVIGTDLSPIQPSFGIPNLTFEIDDCCSAWTYPPNSFDFIHVRGLYGSVQDWPEFYRECMKCLKPGGYIEQLEFSILAKCDDGSSADNEALRLWGEYGFAAGEKHGKTFKVVDNMKGWIEEGGFENVVEQRYKWPIGSWSSDPKLKEIGKWNLVHWEEGVEGWCMMGMTRFLGFSYNQVQAFLGELRLALRNRDYHLYQEVGVVYARKP
ncbi:MAG: hypothetical protein M1812_006706 [Candelaria pacifica]|nr:MAG: hypothetical protein M1812_006706 [Candelaria pacifica]